MHYEHLCTKCEQEFEDEYSIKQDPPTKCPLCGEEGSVKRLISGGSGRGIVELTGHELKAKLREDGQKLKQAAAKNENVLGSMVGESRLHNNMLQESKIRSEYGRRR